MDKKKLTLLLVALFIAVGTALGARALFVGASAPQAAAAVPEAKGPKVLVAQPSHSADISAVMSSACTFVDALDDCADKDVVVDASGSVSGHWSGMDVTNLTNVNTMIKAYLVASVPDAP